MYGHGNNSSQYQQQPPGPLPPPPPHFQQAPPPPPRPPPQQHQVMQQGSMPVYKLAPPRSLSQQGSFQVHGGIFGVGQSYSHSLPHLYVSGANQNLLHNPPGPPLWPPPPPPPPFVSSYSTTPKNESVIHMPSMDVPPPPPLPASPPPHPLSPPPPPPAFPLPSSRTIDAASKSPFISHSSNLTDSQVNSSNSIEEVAPASHNGGNTTLSDDNIKVTSGSSGKINVVLNRSPPPPRQSEEKSAPSTKTLFKLIAETDPESKDIACSKESENEEFDYLNGGDLQIESSIQTGSLKDASSSRTADSDMEMEDDITQFDKDQGHHPSFEFDMLGNELDVKQQTIRSKTQRVNNMVKNDSYGDVSGFGTSGLPEHGSGAGNFYDQHSKGGSPFRLLQDYASDDDSDANYDEPCVENASTVKVSSPIKDQLFFLESQMNVKKAVLKSIIRLKTDEHVEDADEHKKHIRHSASENNFQERDVDLEIGNVDHVRKGGDSQKEDKKCSSTQQKVDEFGRLVRKAANDSDSDDVGHTRRRRKKNRSWSRSISPQNRRRRRSPLRRRERRNRSHSRSPGKRNRSKSPFNRQVGDHGYEKMRRDKRSRSRSRSPEKRNRSKSPIYRRASDYGGEKMRRDQRHMPECLDHLRGKCHRGSSCRYRHHESEKPGGSRSKNKQHYQDASPSLNCTEVQKMQTSQESKKYVNINEKCRDDLQSDISDQESQLLKTDVEKLEVQAVHPSHLHDNNSFQPVEETEQPLVINMACFQTLTESSIIKSPEQITSQKSPTNCSTNDTLPGQISITYPINLPISEPQLNHNPPSHLPPPPPLFSLGVNALQMPQLPTGVRIPYPSPLPNMQPQFSGLPNFNWTSLPPPPPPLAAIPGLPHFPTNHIPSRNEFSSQTFFRPCQPDLPNYSQVQHQYLSVQEPYGSKHLSVGHPLQPFAGPELIRGNFSSAQKHPFSQQQPLPPYSLQQHSAHDNKGSAPLGISVNTISSANPRFPTDNPEMNQLSQLSDIPGSRIATHYNPYASSFDQPQSSKFSSAFRSEKSGDQYDPVFDSIEMSSGENGHVKKWDHTNDSTDIMLRLSESHKPLNVEDKNENDEYGETADAEVGAVENGSFSSPLDIENAAGGEIEVDEIKSRKKIKDSKSMKLFRVALANFVKEVLKPSWRQGNMSKEAFKTIVKKTVDKASAAMKGHQIPKSQAKIDHYIDSSQRKLTKLVMGYVNKYVKA